MQIKVLATGGTIDKVYFDSKSEYQVGPSQVDEIFAIGNVTHRFTVESIISKDSLDFTPEDREMVRNNILNSPEKHILITHGSDTMVETAKVLANIPDKVIVMTGAIQPAGFRNSDAMFNVGCALGALQVLQPGVYIVMNGKIFNPAKTRKNSQLRLFEET